MDMFLKMDTSKEHLEKLYDPDILPDGRKFDFWHCETEFTKTLYVDQHHAAASDENDGSENSPFKTVSAAAARVQPGERIFIKKGEYFETIRDIHGGTDAKHMVLIEGEDGAVITGAIHWKPGFVPSSGYRQTPVKEEIELFNMKKSDLFAATGAKVWMGDLPRDGSLYEYGYNPFFVMNLHGLAWYSKRNCYPRLLTDGVMPSMNRDEHLRKRGEVYVDGRRLNQVIRYFELYEQDDVFFVDEAYKRIHLHLKNNQDPNGCDVQITIKEQGFMPYEPGQSYIYFKNVAFEKFANPIKWPQLSALECHCGHHFIVENCRFSDIHSVALGLGFIGHNLMHEGVRGHHIVRGNIFERCGISGMCATPTLGEYMDNMLVEHNTVRDMGYLDFYLLFETAGLKSHFTRDSLYRFNTFTHVRGAAIWLDNHNCNTRITGNIIHDVYGGAHGALFNEATLDAVLIDHNFLWGMTAFHAPDGRIMGGQGIYEHHSENTVVWENICLDIESNAIHFAYSPNLTRYMYDNKRAALNKDNKAIGNLISGCEFGVSLSGVRDQCNANFIQNYRQTQAQIAGAQEHHSRESLKECYGYENEDSPAASLAYENGVLTVTTQAGKTLTFVPEAGASVINFFRELNGN